MSKKPNLSDLLNDLAFFNTYNRLKNLALNVFKWEGLPAGIKPEYIENALYTYGQALFFNDPNLGLMCLPCAQEGGLNVYGEPIKYRVTGQNGYSKVFEAEESVNIRNNLLRLNTHNYIMMYTNKLVEVDRTLDVHISNIKFPFIVKCGDKDLLTVKNIFKQVQSNEPAIYVDKTLGSVPFEVFNTDMDFWGDKLSDYRHDIENQVLTFLGINNANTDKRERLVKDEVNANNDFIYESVSYMLECRQAACEEINTLFKLNVSVKLRAETEVPEEGGEEDGEVLDGAEGVN